MSATETTSSRPHVSSKTRVPMVAVWVEQPLLGAPFLADMGMLHPNRRLIPLHDAVLSVRTEEQHVIGRTGIDVSVGEDVLIDVRGRLDPASTLAAMDLAFVWRSSASLVLNVTDPKKAGATPQIKCSQLQKLEIDWPAAATGDAGVVLNMRFRMPTDEMQVYERAYSMTWHHEMLQREAQWTDHWHAALRIVRSEGLADEDFQRVSQPYGGQVAVLCRPKQAIKVVPLTEIGRFGMAVAWVLTPDEVSASALLAER